MVSFQSLKVCFIHYFFAYFLARLASRILGFLLDAMDFWEPEGAGSSEILVLFYCKAFIVVLLMALATVGLFLKFKELCFSWPLFIAVAIVFEISGLAGLMGLINGLYKPQFVSFVIPVQFLLGWILVARHVEKENLSVQN